VPNLVSVIIPAYNAARYLGKAIASVQSQGYDPLEILVVDDGSTDTTPAVVQGLRGVRYLHQTNSGPAAARNAGIAAAQGSFLAFLDADDLWAGGKLAAQLSVLEAHPQIHMVTGRVEEFSSETPTLASPKRDYGQRAYTIGALLLRREDFLRVGLLDSQLRFGEFMDWLSRAKALGLCEHWLDQVVLYRRLHAHNTTRLAQDHQSHYLATIRRHLGRQRSIEADGRGGGS